MLTTFWGGHPATLTRCCFPLFLPSFLLLGQELLSQAARILGSVDFLGNPMGLLNDVSEGVTGLIKYGNVGGLIRNVTHGVSNSAAKVRGEPGPSGIRPTKPLCPTATVMPVIALEPRLPLTSENLTASLRGRCLYLGLLVPSMGRCGHLMSLKFTESFTI